MLGKTHVVGSLALAHIGLLGYSKYITRDGATAEVIDVFGLPLGLPESTTDYGLIVTTVLFFVLLLLRLGNKKFLIGYAIATVFGIIGLKIIPDSPDIFVLGIALLLFTLGSVFPDIDSEKSTIGRYFKPISASIPHRTITHTFWVVAILGGLSWYFGTIYLAAFTLGYAIHILEDSFSKQGIAWFYPIGGYDSFSGGGVIKRGRKAIFAYSTGGTGETIIFVLAIIIHIGCVAGYLLQ